MTLSDAGHVSSTRERMVELVKGALIDTDYKVGEREEVGGIGGDSRSGCRENSITSINNKS